MKATPDKSWSLMGGAAVLVIALVAGNVAAGAESRGGGRSRGYGTAASGRSGAEGYHPGGGRVESPGLGAPGAGVAPRAGVGAPGAGTGAYGAGVVPRTEAGVGAGAPGVGVTPGVGVGVGAGARGAGVAPGAGVGVPGAGALPYGYYLTVPTGWTKVYYGGYWCAYVNGLYYRPVYYQGTLVYIVVT